MNKIEIHKQICDKLHDTYKAKNADYGDSFAKVRKKYDDTFLIHLNEKLDRIENLTRGNAPQVKEESIEDNLIDLANYCILELVERQAERTVVIPAEFADEVEKVVNNLIEK